MSEYQVLPPVNNEYIFEELIADLFNEIYHTNEFSLFGRKGQNQKGIDILGNKNSGIVVQCKKKDIMISDADAQKLLKVDIKSDIAKVKELDFKFQRIIFTSTHKNDSIIQEYCRMLSQNETFAIEYWGWQKIIDEILKYPSLIKKYYHNFFSEISKKEYDLPGENHLFTGRKSELNSIIDGFNITNVVVLKGMAGIGKTQIAKKFLYLHKNNYDLICWINANNIEELNNEYHRIAKFFKIDNEQSDDDVDITIEEVKHFFSNSGKNLLIFDNADNIQLGELKRYLPATNSKIIITTQNSRWDTDNYVSLDITDLEHSEAKEFLLSYTKNRKNTNDDEMDSQVLVGLLKSFPLALEHARAYINKRKISIKEYINLYNENSILIMNNELSDYHKTILTTWKISFAKVEEISNKCFPFLAHCSFLFSSDIPIKELFINTKLYSTLELNEIIDIAMSYSLISVDNNYIFMHGMVQEVIRLELKDRNKYSEYLYGVLQLILNVLPVTIKDENDKNISELLIPHAINVLNFEGCGQGELKLGFEIARNIAKTYYNFGNFKEAIIFLNKQLAMIEVTNDIDSYVETLNSIALSYHYIGNPDMALNKLEKALKVLEDPNNILEEDNKSFLKCELSGNYGIILKDKNNLKESLKYFESALELAEKCKNEYLKINQLCNIGNVYKHMGNLDAALLKFEIALNLSEELQDRKLILKQLGNIGAIYNLKSDFPKAIDYFERALSISKELGDRKLEDITLDYLGTCFLELGDLPNAFKFLEDALNLSRKIDFKQGEVNSSINITIYYLKKKDLIMANKYKEYALRLANEIGYQRAIIYINKMNLDISDT